jgi:putative SOS response-associated peptidase YedK
VRHTERTPQRVLSVARWGLVPPWSRDTSGAARMINARAETIATSRAFREAFIHRRCLVPADGWYEWQVDAGGKRPYFLTRPEGVTFGGVWSVWGTGTQSRMTFSIITMPAAGALATVHDRMPLQLDASRWTDWLRGSDPAELLTLPSSEYCAAVEIRPVSAAVGDVRKDGPGLVQRVTPAQSTVDRAPTLF